ncbi:hypothetical protein D3C75_956310 [compost metagenome]
MAEDLAVVPGLAGRCGPGPVPLQPASGVDDRAVFFGKAGGGQAEHFGLDRGAVDIVLFAVVLPETRGLGGQRVDDHQELELGQCRLGLVLVREGRHRVETLGDVAVDLTFEHAVAVVEHVVAVVPLGQPVETPVVVFGRLVAPQAFHQADEELRRVLVVIDLVFEQRCRCGLLEVGGQRGLLIRRQVHVAGQA